MLKVSQEDIQVLENAVKRYGTKAQLRQLQEECAELIAAVNHCFRRRENGSLEFLGEFVDVYIVMYQLFLAAKSEEDFNSMLEVKLFNLKQRLSEEVRND